MKRKLLFVANPVSGKRKALEYLSAVGIRLSDAPGIQYKVYISNSPGSIIDEVRRHQERGYNEFVAIGGDGTLSEVINGLDLNATLTPVVGVIPAGSGNDTARAFDIEAGNQMDAIISNKTEYIDIGSINKRYFINSCSFGIDGPITRDASKFKLGLPGRLSYMVAAIKNAISYSPVKIVIHMNGHKIEEEVLTIALSNGPYLGGGMNIAPNAKTNDGLLDVTIIKPIGMFKIIKNFRKLYNGKISELPFVISYKADKITIDSSNLTQANIDGELIEGVPAEISIHPNKIKFFTSKSK